MKEKPNKGRCCENHNKLGTIKNTMCGGLAYGFCCLDCPYYSEPKKEHPAQSEYDRINKSIDEMAKVPGQKLDDSVAEPKDIEDMSGFDTEFFFKLIDYRDDKTGYDWRFDIKDYILFTRKYWYAKGKAERLIADLELNNPDWKKVKEEYIMQGRAEEAHDHLTKDMDAYKSGKKEVMELLSHFLSLLMPVKEKPNKGECCVNCKDWAENPKAVPNTCYSCPCHSEPKKEHPAQNKGECCDRCVIRDSVGTPIGCHDSNHTCPCHSEPKKERDDWRRGYQQGREEVRAEIEKWIRSKKKEK